VHVIGGLLPLRERVLACTSPPFEGMTSAAHPEKLRASLNIADSSATIGSPSELAVAQSEFSFTDIDGSVSCRQDSKRALGTVNRARRS
jgi:hypothetical protein